MNAKGKELMARIVAAITRTLNACKQTPISMKWKEVPTKQNKGLGEAKMELEKEIQSKTRMTVLWWKIIIVEGKRMRQLRKLQEDVERYL
jgi:hypothetical protein